MIKKETSTIDGMDFTVVQFPAMHSFRLLAKLIKTIGPAISALSGVDPSTDLSSLAPVLSDALANLDPDDAARLALEILACATLTVTDATGPRLIALNNQANVDLVFTSRLKTMMSVLMFAIRVNFADFMGGSVPTAPQTPTPSAP